MTARVPYRPDIDGLRAVAVLNVIFFHAGFAWAGGGFLGVDVFFVISGYLITGILLREHREGTFSLARFYERRARRILPALLLVVAATLIACVVLMVPSDARVVARSAVAVIAFFANIMFWRGVDFGDVTTVNYFGRRLHEQPLIHTWSLGVEEQYYLLFPLALLLVWRVRPKLVLPFLVAGTGASLLLSVWLTPRSPGVAFYLLPTRAWQLLAGGLVAWTTTTHLPARRWLHECAAAAGLLLILVPAFIYDRNTPFPGIHALVPVAGTMLLLRFAEGSKVGAALSWRPLVFIGLISYSAYLWHQPLFALARYLVLTDELDRSIALLLCVVTVVLAAATWRFVETPFRNRRVVGTPALVWFSVAATLIVLTPAAYLAFGGDAGRRTPTQSGIVGQSMLSLFSDCNITLQPTRGLGLGCLLDPSSSDPPSFLVVGDSHAESIFPAFAKISRETGRQGRLLQHIACAPLLDVGDVPTGTPGCLGLQQAALDAVQQWGIRSVFLVSRFSYLPKETFAARVEKTVAAYAERGATVFLIAQAPEQRRFLRRQYLRFIHEQRFFGLDRSEALRQHSSTRQEHDALQSFVMSVFASYRDDRRVRVIDATAEFCDSEVCWAGDTLEPFYVDEHHINAAGALKVSGAIAQQAGWVD